MKADVDDRLTFNGFEIRTGERQLVIDGRPAPIGARAFDVLLALVERRDRVVSKAELLDLGWPGLVVEENNLSVQISSLRKLLGANAIVTVVGRGYRFAAAPAAPAVDAVPLPALLSSQIVRRLSAIVGADIVDWARELAADASAATSAWSSARRTLIESLVPGFGGRVIELSSRGVLLEFVSAVDATRWALDLQSRLAQRRSAADGVSLHMRVGIGVEDVVVDDGKLVGDAEQVPVRLLRAGRGDQIIVDNKVYALADGKLPARFIALDDAAAETGRGSGGPGGAGVVYRVEPLLREAEADDVWRPNWETCPGVAVLPFATDAGEADTYFGDGMTEEIVTSLSVNRSLLVIARSSTLRYRHTTRPPATIAAELGVRYLLVGTVRRMDRRLRIGAELIDADGSRVIWAERFDGFDEDLFTFQNRIASSIAAAIDPRVQEAEMARVAGRPTQSLTAYDCVLRGLSVLNTFRGTDFALAGELFARAIALDPRYAQAHAHLAWWHNLRVGEGRSPAMDEDAREAERLSQRAVALDPRDAWALSVAGHIQSFVRKRFQVAMDMFEQALTINPSCAIAWSRSATTLAYLGRGEEALQRARNAMRLSPFDPNLYAFCTTNGTAAFVTGRYDEAVGWLEKALRINPGYHAARRILVAALALAGDLNNARAQAQEFQALEPAFRVSNFATWYPLCEPHLSRMLEGMRAAGLPE